MMRRGEPDVCLTRTVANASAPQEAVKFATSTSWPPALDRSPAIKCMVACEELTTVLLRKFPFQYVKKLPFAKPVPKIVRSSAVDAATGDGLKPAIVSTVGTTLK